MRWLRFLSLGLWLLVGCSGCDSEEAPPDKGNVGNLFEGLNIQVTVPAVGGLKTDWEPALREWSIQHGGEVTVSEYPYAKGSGELSSNISEADVRLIPWSVVPELMAKEGFAEIPETVQAPDQLNWSGYFSGLRNQAASLGGQPRLVPIACPVLVCYYRRDLLEDAKLAPPKTWDDYQKLLDTLSDWAPGFTAVEPWSESFRASMFLARSAAIAKHSEQFSFCFDRATGEPLIASPGFVEALQKAKLALAKMPPEVTTFSPGDCRREILSGKAALAIGYETEINQDTAASEMVRIGISPLPGTRRVFNTSINEWVQFDKETLHQVTFTGFTGWAIGVRAELEDAENWAAWELTRYLAIEQLPQLYPSAMVSVCRDSQTESASRWTGPQLTASESESYVAAVTESLQNRQLVMELPLIGHQQYRAALTEGLTTAMNEENNEQAILSAVAEKWRGITEQLGQENVVRSYQFSHR
ncbi:MAG: extracellular solute-binding protein [Planctomycetaceae bacterium]|nr:extracellular solute-binding protein [Planctomycetaceae bacterium]